MLLLVLMVLVKVVVLLVLVVHGPYSENSHFWQHPVPSVCANLCSEERSAPSRQNTRHHWSEARQGHGSLALRARTAISFSPVCP